MKMKMKNRSGFLGLLTMIAATVVMVMIFAGSYALEAQAETTGKVTASAVNVRKKADANSDKVGGILKGESFVVKSETTGADGKVWYLIVTEDGTEGYVRSDLVSVSGSTSGTTSTASDNVTKLNPVSGKVTGSTVNVRKSANAKSDKVTSVKEGTVITIVGQTNGADNKVWYQVTFISDNKEVQGFIRSDLVDPSGTLTPYTEPVQEPEQEPEKEPEKEPETQAPETQEPVVQEKKDWDTVLVDEKWMLIENASGKYYGVNDLIQISKENALKLEEANATVKSQKVTIVVLVLILIVLALAVAFIVFRFKDLLMEEFFGMKEEPAPVRKPQGARPQGARPAGAPQGARPAGAPTGARPAGAPQGARPAGAPQGARPAGARPQGARPAGVEPIAPAFDMTGTDKEAQIRQETARGIEAQKAEQKIVPNDAGKKPKNFMADEDEFEFEFLNWDGEDEE